jgi:radical SAM protein with 4Fe4S-binding SPASM domain
MSEQIIAKLDEIEANTVAKIEEGKVETTKLVDEKVASFEEKVANLEAKISQLGATPTIKTYKTISQEVNRSVKEQLKSFVNGEAKIQKELKMWADESQYDAYVKEASALTGGGAGVGGRTAYDPVFVPLRLANPMRGVARAVATDGATYQFRAKVGNKMKIFFVVPDYFGDRPKKCMNGWGEVFMIVTANGDVLPCHSARVLPNMEFPNVRDKGLMWAWQDSPAFNRYRGDSWMKEPCRTCPEKENDLGGCRCQAFLLSGDAESADPVCSLSPNHHIIKKAIEDAKNPVLQAQPILFRNDKNSKKILSGEANDLIKDFHATP